MGGTENLISDLIDDCDRSPAFLLDAIHCLRIDRAIRNRIGNIIRKARTKGLVYAILLAGNRLVNVVRGKDLLHPSDLLLLMNVVTNSQSLRSSESWTPICLPKFSDKGFLYAYVCYLADDVCLTLITMDAGDFYPLRDCKNKIVEGMKKKQCLGDIKTAMSNQRLLIDELEIGVPECRHFLYKSETTSQFIAPVPAVPFASRQAQKQLFRRYQQIHSRIHDSKWVKRHTIYYEVSENATMLAWVRPGEFEMYATFTPLVSKEAAITACNRALRWIKREEDSLFLP